MIRNMGMVFSAGPTDFGTRANGDAENSTAKALASPLRVNAAGESGETVAASAGPNPLQALNLPRSLFNTFCIS
jgi:hypothetical protein